MKKIELGKIQDARLGFGGYQDEMFGISFNLGGKGWGCGDFWGTWGDATNWTKDQSMFFGDIMKRLIGLFNEAKVTDIQELVGVPIEVTFEDGVRSSWRILTEVK